MASQLFFEIEADLVTRDIFTHGIFSPCVVIPGNLQGKEIEYVIYHELCHIKHNDNLFIFIRIIVNSLYWFNPLFYFMNNYLGQVSELACDEIVVKKCDASERNEYANILIKFALGNSLSQQAITMNLIKKRKCFFFWHSVWFYVVLYLLLRTRYHLMPV